MQKQKWREGAFRLMKGKAWIWWVSGRFILGRRNGRGRLLFLFSVVLIAAGVGTLNTVLAVMNGLQQGYIRTILEIGSYHIRWSPGFEIESQKINTLMQRLQDLPGVLFAAPFRDGKTILSGLSNRQSPALVRGHETDVYTKDKAMARSLVMVDGEFSLDGASIVLGERLALSLNVKSGDKIFAMNIDNLRARQVELIVSGLFRSSYAEYERSLAFVSIDTSRKIFLQPITQVGIKIENPNRDFKVMETMETILFSNKGSLKSWRELNKSFFGALRTEKNMMFLLLGLIFIVVSVNIDQSLRRMVTERMEDIAILRALGSSTFNSRLLFICQAVIIGGSGTIAGTVLGVLLARNIDRLAMAVLKFTGRSGNMWSLAIFRSTEIMLPDVILVFVVSMLLSTMAALHSARLAAMQKPQEVLRGE